MTTAPMGLRVSGLDEQDGSPSMLDSSSLTTPARPGMADRTLSSPPISPDFQIQAFQDLHFTRLQASQQDILTPPISPIQQYQINNSIEVDSPIKSAIPRTLPWPSSQALNLDAFVQPSGLRHSTSPNEVSVLEYPYELEIAKDDTGRNVKFGDGAWSTVYKAVSLPSGRPSQDAFTTTTVMSRLSPLIVAVKTPARRDGRDILRSEAQILSHLVRKWGPEDYVVPFHGFITSTSSIVMSAVPLSLSQHITNKLHEVEQNPPNFGSNPPVLGSEATWLSLAICLIGGLQWLHEVAEVIHGDIKPHNILLLPMEDPQGSDEIAFPYKPLFVDFSSACHLSATSRLSAPGALSAVTREYTAPELLISTVLRNPSTLPTTASDVFSMAVTLLVAATGDLNVYPAPNMIQRQAMASQGWGVIGFARNGNQGLRIPRHGIVEQVLERAVLKAGMGRVNARTWASLVRQKVLGDPTKKA